MALTIKENNGVFTVEGSINTDNAKHFQSHFETVLASSGELTIDIDKVNKIDTRGVDAIKALYANALNYSRSFYILGNGCKEIYEEIQSDLAAA